ncbi:DUF2606 family protein [Polaribacter batillariae]|uniref:DUF2606 family protein n=1 Tax=Polaribacter batillariae TaxID=2808900 RepID=A0ABX7SU91_9FLAO|nr:DUF2606 family protein [Polaribacter batillariae]QTD36403.1 DUF2606 family protein [Polaribacter batillariae]
MKYKNIVIVFILLSICFMSCLSKKGIIEVKIQAIETAKNQPRKNLRVEVLKVKNPLFSMRSFILIHTLRTDDKGIISFKTNEKGNYSIRFYRDTRPVPFYWIDTLKVKDLKENKFFKLSW